jgi:hypothetical protein
MAQRPRQRNGKIFAPVVAPGTAIDPADYAAAKAAAGGPTNRHERRLAKKKARSAAATCPTPATSLPARPRQEQIHVTAAPVVDTKYDAEPVDNTPKPTPHDQQKAGVRYCDGYEVVASENALTDAVGGDGQQARHSQMLVLLLVDGREVFGCALCSYWNAARDDVRAHLRTHNSARTNAAADYLTTYLRGHGFDEGPFTPKQVWDSGISRSRFPAAADVGQAIVVLIGRGHVVELPGSSIVRTFALATSQIGQAAKPTPEPEPEPQRLVDAWLAAVQADPRQTARDRAVARAYAHHADDTDHAELTGTQIFKTSGVPLGSIHESRQRLVAEGYLEFVSQLHSRAPARYRLVLPTTVAEAAAEAAEEITAAAPAPALELVPDAGDEPQQAGDDAGDSAVDVADEQPAPAGDAAGDDEEDPGDDEGNARLAEAAARLPEVLAPAPKPAGVPTPAQVAAMPHDFMALPLSALISRVQQVESYRVAQAKANDRAVQAENARRDAESKTREAVELSNAAVREAEAAVADAEQRAAEAEARAQAAEEALAAIRGLVGLKAA